MVFQTPYGTCLVSQEFEQFLITNGIRHFTSSPYHPATNGLAERAVQIVKNGLKREKEGSLSLRLSKVLFNYRISPHNTTNVTPAELMFGRVIKSKLDLVSRTARDAGNASITRYICIMNIIMTAMYVNELRMIKMFLIITRDYVILDV